MPDHGARIQQWYAKHTGWRAWEDLSNSELQKWMRWFRHHAGVLRGGGLHNIPPTVAMVVQIPLQQVLPGLQQLRQSLRAVGSWLQKDQTLQCAVVLQRYSAHDFMQDHSAKNRLVELCGAMVEREFRALGNVVFTYTESAVESELQIKRCKAGAWWRSASVRLESGTAGGQDTLPSLLLANTLQQAWQGEHFFPPGPKLTKAALTRHLSGGGKRSKKAPKLWLFYMDDSAPHPHQVKIHAASRAEALPWTSHTPRLQEPGEKLARFVGTYVTGPGPHLVLVPTWAPGERAELSPTCTALGYKPTTTSLLQHVQPWVACEDTATMYAAIRAGKQLVFRSSPSTRGDWGEYMQHLLPLSDQDTYESMLKTISPAQLREFGKTHLTDYTPAFHTLLTEQLNKSEQEVVWAE